MVKKILLIATYVLLTALVVLLIYENKLLSDNVDVLQGKLKNAPVEKESGSGQPEASSDQTAPLIDGVKNITIHVGETVSYKSGITVSDDTDSQPQLEIDSSNVDTSKVGAYVVIYKASDAAGNIAVDAATVSVIDKDAVTLEQANALADTILAQTIKPEMTDYQKLWAVWHFIHNIGYTEVDYGVADDYLENAYYFLKELKGNCRCFYGASKLLLERLGYKTQMVHNSEDAERNHYWNLVSVDGGQEWYHFDPTDWNWNEEGGQMCMVCDDTLWEYAQMHDFEGHDWDRSLYPKTPDHDYYQ